MAVRILGGPARLVQGHFHNLSFTIGAGPPSASMAVHDYHFVTTWHFDQTTCEEISDVLSRAEDLPRWWPTVYLSVKVVAPGDVRGIGKRVELHTRGWLPYTLRWSFVVIESRTPHGFTLDAQGDFVGRGAWTFTPDAGGVRVVYDWGIRAEKGLIRTLSPVLKPLFAWNHHWAMRQGQESLRRELARRRAP